MKKKILVTVLILTIVFMFSAVPGFAATKKITQVAEKDYDYINGSYKLTYTWENTYNTKGVRTRFDATRYDYSSGKKKEYTYRTNYKYDGGKVKSEIMKENGKNKRKYTYTYKKSGKTSQINYYEYSTKQSKFVKKEYTKFTYSSTKETETNYNAKGKVLYKFVRTLNSKGRVTKEVGYEGTKKYYTLTYDYYTNGKVKQENWKYTDGSTDVYKYNKKGNITSSVATMEDMILKTVYKYNDYDLVSKEIDTSDYGDGDIEKTTTTYIYSNFYNSNHKYPKTTVMKIDGEKICKYVRTFKMI